LALVKKGASFLVDVASPDIMVAILAAEKEINKAMATMLESMLQSHLFTQKLTTPKLLIQI